VLVPEAGGSGLCGWWPYAVSLARHHFRVLLFDPRCFGLSSCPRRGVGLLAADVTAAVALLHHQGCTAVEVVGASAGGSAALVAAAHDRHITAIADLSGDENTTPMSKHRPRTADAAAGRIRQPTLIAVARDDPYVTVHAERAIASALATPRKRLLVEPNRAGHGWDMLANPGGSGWSKLAATLTRFLSGHRG
jgi:pimeloyl-ACP methyl ester carboxylesterase